MESKVTLLRPENATYTAYFFGKEYSFRGGRKKKIPAAIAMKLRKILHKGKPLFNVEDLPEVITEEVEEAESMQEHPAPGLLQISFGSWAANCYGT